MAAIVTAAARRQAGYTLVEIIVAVTILTAGSAVLWYGLRSSAAIVKLNRMHHAAHMLARSDLECLRTRPKEDIHDTLYLGSGVGSDSLVLVRTVMDSARIANTLDELVLDETLSPKEWRKPIEVRVRVYQLAQGEEDPAFDPAGFQARVEEDAAEFPTDGNETRPRVLVSLIAKLPEYKWW